jgi:hypothetical protein
VSGQPRRNEDRFYEYPMNRVVAIIHDDAQLDATLAEVERVGVTMSAVNVLSGPKGAGLLDRSGARHGPLARLLRVFQGGAYESDTLEAHERALNDGQHVIYVPVRNEKDARLVAEILRSAGGRRVLYFGVWSIAELPPQTAG